MRILDAAEDLLEDREFDEITMPEIAERAGCAVGTVYGRVPGKDALLACLYDRFAERLSHEAASFEKAAIGALLSERVELLCRLLVEHYSERPGVVRALAAHLFSRHGEGFGEFRRHVTREFRRLARVLEDCGDEIEHPNPRSACEFGLMCVTLVAQNRLVFGERSGVQVRVPRQRLRTELARLLMAYLRAGHPARSR